MLDTRSNICCRKSCVSMHLNFGSSEGPRLLSKAPWGQPNLRPRIFWLPSYSCSRNPPLVLSPSTFSSDSREPSSEKRSRVFRSAVADKQRRQGTIKRDGKFYRVSTPNLHWNQKELSTILSILTSLNKHPAEGFDTAEGVRKLSTPNSSRRKRESLNRNILERSSRYSDPLVPHPNHPSLFSIHDRLTVRQILVTASSRQTLMRLLKGHPEKKRGASLTPKQILKLPCNNACARTPRPVFKG